MFEAIYLNLISEESIWMIPAAAEADNPDGEYHALRAVVEEVLTERKLLADTFGEKHIEISTSSKRMYRHFPAIAEVFEEEDGNISSMSFWERCVYYEIMINGRYIQSSRDVQHVKAFFLLRMKEEKLAALWNQVFDDAQPAFGNVADNQCYLENILFLLDVAFQFPDCLKELMQIYFESEEAFNRFFLISAFDSKTAMLRKVVAKGEELLEYMKAVSDDDEEQMV